MKQSMKTNLKPNDQVNTKTNLENHNKIEEPWLCPNATLELFSEPLQFPISSTHTAGTAVPLEMCAKIYSMT